MCQRQLNGQLGKFMSCLRGLIFKAPNVSFGNDLLFLWPIQLHSFSIIKHRTNANKLSYTHIHRHTIIIKGGDRPSCTYVCLCVTASASFALHSFTCRSRERFKLWIIGACTNLNSSCPLCACKQARLHLRKRDGDGWINVCHEQGNTH